MKVLTIQSLRYKNFKGISDFTLEPNGNTSIFGDNGTGKSTLFDGTNWLFFGKDSHGKADFQVKPTDKDGNEIHNLETEVEGTFDFNGKTIALKKRLYENYTKKRGEAQKSFTGNKKKFWIDKVPAKEKEFNSKVSELLNIDAFKLVTNPAEFNSLHWQKQRDLLLTMCGDVSDQDVIDSDKSLKTLSSILGDCSADDHKKKIQEKKREINKELTEIPARISENQEVVKDAVKPDQKEKDRLDNELEDEQEKLRTLTSNEALSAKQTRLNEVNGEIQRAQNEANQKQAESRKPLLDEIDKLEAERRESLRKIADLGDQIGRDEKRNETSSDAIKKVGERWYAEDAKTPSDDHSCPTCGQDMPEDQIQSTIKIFNKMKSDRLEAIEKEGGELKKGIASRQKDIDAAKVSIDALQKVVDGIEKELSVKKADLAEIYEPLSVDTDALDKEKDVLESEIAALRNGSKTQENTAKRHISGIQEKISEWSKADAAWKSAEKTRDRITELEDREKELAKEFEDLESELFLIEKFIVAKVGMLEEQINSKFKLARFKMFETQINGGINECCETLYNGVPFNRGLNSAAQINVGLDIINTLSDYFGFKAPVWIDNAESINEIIPMDCQVINLVVSRDKELTVSETEALKAS